MQLTRVDVLGEIDPRVAREAGRGFKTQRARRGRRFDARNNEAADARRGSARQVVGECSQMS